MEVLKSLAQMALSLMQHNKPPKPPSASRVSKPRRNDEGEPVELIEHRKRVSSGAVKPQEPDPVYCPIQVNRALALFFF